MIKNDLLIHLNTNRILIYVPDVHSWFPSFDSFDTSEAVTAPPSPASRRKRSLLIMWKQDLVVYISHKKEFQFHLLEIGGQLKLIVHRSIYKNDFRFFIHNKQSPISEDFMRICWWGGQFYYLLAIWLSTNDLTFLSLRHLLCRIGIIRTT